MSDPNVVAFVQYSLLSHQHSSALMSKGAPVWTFAMYNPGGYWSHKDNNQPTIGTFPNKHPRTPDDFLSEWGDSQLVEQIELKAGSFTTYRHVGSGTHYEFVSFLQVGSKFMVICILNQESLDNLKANPALFFTEERLRECFR